MKKAHAYLRVSGKGQVEGDGFTRQLKAIREYAAAHDMKVVNVYREEGVSGTKESADRPAWSELMTALHSNGVSVVLIERLDRLARDLMIQETIIGPDGERSHAHPGAANDGRRRSIREVSNRSETPRRAAAQAGEGRTLRGTEALRVL